MDDIIIPKEIILQKLKPEVTKEIETAMKMAGKPISVEDVQWVAEGIKIILNDSSQ